MLECPGSILPDQVKENMPNGAKSSVMPNNATLLRGLEFSAISDLVPAGIFVSSVEDGRVVYANPSFGEILGLTESDVLGRDWEDFFYSLEDRNKLTVSFAESGVVRNREVRLRNVSGRPVWVAASMAHLEGEEDDFLITSFVDVTPLRDAVAAADKDALTGLANIRCFRDRLERAVSRARRHKDRVGVLFVDLDNFKAVNDTYGHDVGDIVLQEVGQRLEQVVRSCDTVGRLGGDEFVLMLTDVKEYDDLQVVAKRAVDALSVPIVTADWAVRIGASVGISSFPEHAADADVLLKLADRAMYDVKHNGKNGFRIAA